MKEGIIMAKKHSLAQARYDSTHCRTYNLKLNISTDSDIIAKLDSMESKQGYIKQLIREDLTRTRTDSVSKIDTVENQHRILIISEDMIRTLSQKHKIPFEILLEELSPVE